MFINNIKTNNSRPRRIAAGALLLALSLATTPATQAAEVTCANAGNINADSQVNCFKPNTPAKSAEVNANFERLLQRIKDLEAKLAAVTYDAGQKKLQIEGVNVHIVNGLGETYEFNGTGNLIIGYNRDAVREICSDGYSETQQSCEAAGAYWAANQRTGSHNMVIGDEHQYIRSGGFVAGWNNALLGMDASVSGGYGNTASGHQSSISGGSKNTARGRYASVSGGSKNTARGRYASVSGGELNIASANYTSVSGGELNIASAIYSSVSGGRENKASGERSSVSGGSKNTASGWHASISGGEQNKAEGKYASVSGGSKNTASGDDASVIGGQNNTASANYSIAP